MQKRDIIAELIPKLAYNRLFRHTRKKLWTPFWKKSIIFTLLSQKQIIDAADLCPGDRITVWCPSSNGAGSGFQILIWSIWENWGRFSRPLLNATRSWWHLKSWTSIKRSPQATDGCSTASELLPTQSWNWWLHVASSSRFYQAEQVSWLRWPIFLLHWFDHR